MTTLSGDLVTRLFGSPSVSTAWRRGETLEEGPGGDVAMVASLGDSHHEIRPVDGRAERLSGSEWL